jgi:hypothetical protein
MSNWGRARWREETRLVSASLDLARQGEVVLLGINVQFGVLAEIDTEGGILEASVVQEGLGSLSIEDGVIDNEDSVEGLDRGEEAELSKGLGLYTEVGEEGSLLKVVVLEVGEGESVGGDGGGGSGFNHGGSCYV